MPKYKVGDKVMFDVASGWYNSNAGVVLTVLETSEDSGTPCYVVIGGVGEYAESGMYEDEHLIIPAVLLD